MRDGILTKDHDADTNRHVSHATILQCDVDPDDSIEIESAPAIFDGVWSIGSVERPIPNTRVEEGWRMSDPLPRRYNLGTGNPNRHFIARVWDLNGHAWRPVATVSGMDRLRGIFPGRRFIFSNFGSIQRRGEVGAEPYDSNTRKCWISGSRPSPHQAIRGYD